MSMYVVINSSLVRKLKLLKNTSILLNNYFVNVEPSQFCSLDNYLSFELLPMS